MFWEPCITLMPNLNRPCEYRVNILLKLKSFLPPFFQLEMSDFKCYSGVITANLDCLGAQIVTPGVWYCFLKIVQIRCCSANILSALFLHSLRTVYWSKCEQINKVWRSLGLKRCWWGMKPCSVPTTTSHSHAHWVTSKPCHIWGYPHRRCGAPSHELYSLVISGRKQTSLLSVHADRPISTFRFCRFEVEQVSGIS